MKQLLFLLTLLGFMISPLQGAEGQHVQERYTKVAMRMIGHEVLQCLGDEDSRVLPIEKIDDRYQISFTAELAFEPSDLVSVIVEVMDRAAVANNYLVEVAHCTSREVVYAFAVFWSDNKDIRPCTGRMLPKACYQLLVTIMDDTSSNVGHATSLAHDSSSYRTNVGTRVGSFAQIRFWAIPVLLFIGLSTFLFMRKAPVASSSTLLQIGSFRFDQRTLVLSNENTKIQLSHKEAELLQVLHQSANTPVERAVLLRRIWGDEGSYVGRTLDVFVSKLRKKLAVDNNIQIVNVRGVGYKLIMDFN